MVISSATGISLNRSASSLVMLLSWTIFASRYSGAGLEKACATSGRDTFAIILFAMAMLPSVSRFNPFARYLTTVGVRLIYPAASIILILCFKYNSTILSSMGRLSGWCNKFMP